MNKCKNSSGWFARYKPRGLAARATMLLACLFCAFPAATFPAKADSIATILENLGNVGRNGLPSLSFDFIRHPSATELKSLGFAFKLQHQAGLAHGRKARTDWRISALGTAVYFDEQGDLAWLHPNGRTVRYPKTEVGFARAGDGSTARVSPDGKEVEISTPRGVIWSFKEGFLESARSGRHEYSFKTDRETILAVRKNAAADSRPETNPGGGIPAAGKPLLEVKYSETGQLSEIVFADGKKCSFQWTPDNCLQRVHGDAGAELAFEYDDRLLKNWRQDDGALHELQWVPMKSTRRLAFGAPPVLLGADSLYQYRWSRKESMDVLDVSRKSGGFVSRTHFSSKGIIQQTPGEELRHVYEKRK